MLVEVWNVFLNRLFIDDVCCMLESNVILIFDLVIFVVLLLVFKILDVLLIVLKEFVLLNNYENDFFFKNFEEYVLL